MDNVKISPLKVFSFIVLIILIAVLGNCAYQIFSQADKGKDWCESLIQEYEKDPEKFLEAHSSNPRDGRLILKPSPEQKDVMATFTVENSGECTCTYWHGGTIGPHAYKYTSKTQEWKYID